MSPIFDVQDLNNYDSDPEAFAESLARDLEIDDPEVAVRCQPSFRLCLLSHPAYPLTLRRAFSAFRWRPMSA